MSSRFSPMLYSKSFIVLCFTFRPRIYFDLFFVKGVRSLSRFIFLHVDVQLFQHHWLRDYLCSIVLPLLLCQRSVDCIYVGLFLGCLFSSIDLFVYSFTNTTLFLKKFIYLFRLLQVLVAAYRIFSCGMLTLSCGMRTL